MTQSRDPAIRVRGLRKRYPGADRAAVDGVDLDVARGEVVALLGPNGAGRTSTVEVLEGYRDRDAGDVAVLADRLAVITGGRIVAEGPPAALAGGRSMPATVSWTDADGPHRETTPTPAAAVARLSARSGGEVPGLAVHRPSLEEVCLWLLAAEPATGQPALAAAGGAR